MFSDSAKIQCWEDNIVIAWMLVMIINRIIDY